MIERIVLVFFLIIPLSLPQLFGAEVIDYPTENILFRIDTTNTETFLSIKSKSFSKSSNQSRNPGFNNYTYWYSLNLDTIKDHKEIIQLSYTGQDSVDVFFVIENGQVDHYKSGSLSAFNSRELKNRLPSFNLPEKTKKVFFRVRSELPIRFNVKLYDDESYHKSFTIDLLLFALLHLSILLVLVYNFILFVRLKQSIYGYYSAYLTSLFLAGLALSEYMTQFIFTSGEPINYWFINAVVSLMLISFCLFTSEVLNFKKNISWLNKLYKTITFLGIICLFASPFVERNIVSKALHLLPAIAMLTAVYGAIIVLKKGIKSAQYYLIGWGFFFVGALLMQAQGWGIIPINAWSSNLSFIGAALETIFFSFTISEKMKGYLSEIEMSKTKLNSTEGELEVLRKLMLVPNKGPVETTQVNKENINQYLLNPLSERELEVLNLLSKGMTNKKVAEELFVSVNTIKTHTRNIYEKLDVKNRTEAVNKASDLEII